MSWDFETEPEFQAKLDWIDAFVREQVEPLDLAFREPGAPYVRDNPVYQRVTAPLKAEVRREGLWACHLGPELGGAGAGQVQNALLNEVIGVSHWAPVVFGSQAPVSITRISTRRFNQPRSPTYLPPSSLSTISRSRRMASSFFQTLKAIVLRSRFRSRLAFTLLARALASARFAWSEVVSLPQLATDLNSDELANPTTSTRTGFCWLLHAASARAIDAM